MQLFPPNGTTTPVVTGVTAANGLTLTGGTLAFSTSGQTWVGNAIGISLGGTGQTTAAASFNALSPMTAQGDTLYGGSSGAGTRLAIGSAAQVLTVNGGATAPVWAAAPGSNVVDAYLTAQSGAVTVCTTTPGADGTYRVGGFLTITAVTLDVLNLQIVWKDETNTTRTVSLFANGLTTVSLAATGVYLFSPVDIRVKSGNAITLQTILTTGTGSIVFDVGGSIQYIRA